MNGKATYVPLDPQPEPDTIFEVHMYYTLLKGYLTYKRRITWFGNHADGVPSIACFEYSGAPPSIQPAQHGNSKMNTAPCRKTTPETMDKIKEKCVNNSPTMLYNELVSCGVSVRDTCTPNHQHKGCHKT